MRIPGELSVQGRLENMPPDMPLVNFFRGLKQPISNLLRLTLTILHELYVQKSKSRWWPYLKMLEDTVDVDLPLRWSAEERAALRGTAVMLDGEEDASAAFTNLVAPLIELSDDFWPSDMCNEAAFFRCLSWVMSRGVWGGLAFPVNGGFIPSLEAGIGGTEKGPFLLPVFDLVNHSSWSEEGSVDLRFENGAFIVRALRDLKAGEEILHSYGEHGGAELLRTYGFVEAGPRPNPNNRLLVTETEVMGACRSAIGTGASLDTGRLDLLRQRGLMKPVFVVSSSGDVPADLLTLVQVLLMDPKEFEEFKSSDLNLLGKKFHARGTLHANRVVACLMMVLASTRRRYGDEPGEASNVRLLLARKVRKGELDILKAMQSYILTYLAPGVTKGRKRKSSSSASSVKRPTDRKSVV